MLKQKYFLTGIFILSAERQPIKLAWRKIVWLHFNDKCLLTLLRIANIQNKERKRLEKMYCDRFQGYQEVKDFLYANELLKYNGELVNGEWIVDKESPVEITGLGLNAIRYGLFVSETRKQFLEKRYIRLRDIGLIISIIGGLLGFISFFC